MHAMRRRAFSLIELVIVVVIIGIIGAIAIPRMSRGAAGAGDSALIANLSQLRAALDLFQTENGTYPTFANMPQALTTYSDGKGNVQSTKDTTFIYGPYIRAIPPVPTGSKKGATGISSGTTASRAYTGTGSVGWFYDASTGDIWANSDGSDASGKTYISY
jgi:general secretion pathway protein G